MYDSDAPGYPSSARRAQGAALHGAGLRPTPGWRRSAPVGDQIASEAIAAMRRGRVDDETANLD